MKTFDTSPLSRPALTLVTLLAVVLAGVPAASGQGTITFDSHPGLVGFQGTNYYELGMGFRVASPGGGIYDSIYVTEGGNTQVHDGTPYMAFFNQYSGDNYVAFGLMNAATFGLTSVQLADVDSPSYTPLPITFRGFTAVGFVTETFTTPGNGATTFLSYSFDADFASGLTSVAILTGINPAHWAMDNLAFTVPEPAAGSLVVVGLLIFATRKMRTRRRT